MTKQMPDPTTTGRKLQVCKSGCPYNTLAGAVSAAVNGDTIEVQYGDYPECVWVTPSNLVIRGIPDASGNRPHFHGVTCGQKGILVIEGTNTLIEGLELSDVRDGSGGADLNWAGIRFDAGAVNLKIRNCYIHDNDNGILGNNNALNGSDNIVQVENSLFVGNGRDGHAHGMYIGTGITSFNLFNSVVRSNNNDGHLVKSRAQSGTIACNTLAGLDGTYSHGINLPLGGTYYIRSNVLEQGRNVINSNNYFIRYGEDGAVNPPHKLQVNDNYFVNDFSAAGRITLTVSADTSGWQNNKFVGTGGMMTLENTATWDASAASSFTNFADRASAGLPAYSPSITSLPTIPCN